MRSLDLRNLESLLRDTDFRESCLETFFADDMARFSITEEPATQPTKSRTRSGSKKLHVRENVASTIHLIGESITRYVAEAAVHNEANASLEDISGHVEATELSQWASRLSRLKSITLFDGSILNKSVAAAINNHCASFDDLTFCFWLASNGDSNIASFFCTLKSNSLRSFTALSAQEIGPRELQALNNHSASLKTLKLDGLGVDASMSLGLLRDCEALEMLALQGANKLLYLAELDSDNLAPVVSWLGRCDQLRELCVRTLVGAPAILADLCLRDNIRLRKLELIGYPVVGSREFHRALSWQTSLESLTLHADTEDWEYDDTVILVASICKLTNLRELDLCEASDNFPSSETSQIALSLPQLEKFTISGYDLTDTIWPDMAGLRYLRALTIHAISSFTFDGFLNYINALHPTNHGIVLSVMSQNKSHDLSDSEKTVIQTSIMEKVDGRFEFFLYRDTH